MVLPSTTGNDVIIGYGTDDVLTGNLGNDTISGSGGNDLVDGEDGNDSINGDSGNDTVIGGLGTDTLKGGTGNDLLLGGDGNDVLAGEAGDDILEGGVGNDALDGGAGSDIYRFNRGWGQDTISSYDTSANRVDAILFGADIAASDIQVSRSGNQLILTLTGTTDRIVVNEYFQSDATTGYRVDEVRFADGTVWTIGQIKTMVLPSTAGNDVIIGYGTDDALAGGLGNDTISGYGGNDIVDGGDGNDSLSGDSGNDTVIGSLGADNLKGGTGNDLLLGGDGNDVLAGEAGSDVLEGGVGNDALDGGADSDIYRFNRGWGQDTISSYDTSANRVDAIVFGADIAASDIQVSRSGNQLILTLTGTTDRVVVNEFFQSDATTGYRVDEVRFADGTVWTIGQIKTMVLPSTTGNDVIIGYGTDDVLTGNLGNDTISGSAGNDFLDGEDGNDSLNGDSGNDTVIGGLGTDNLKGGTGNDLLLGGDGNDVLAGEAGDDILEGGVGNDALDGGAGSDIYRFNRGWGQDTISSYDTSANRVDAIVFGADVAASDIQASRSGNQLILTLTGTTDRIVVNEFFQSDATTGYRVDEVRFADGTVWNIAQIKTMVLPGTAGNDVISGYGSDDVLSGSHGNDTMSGFAGNDVIQGEEGNDSLKGGAGHDLLLGGDGTDLLAGEAGNDTLEGGAGNDALEGGADSDLYRFSRGWGQDTINNNDSGTGKVDAIEFAGDIAPGEVNITRSGTNLVLSLAGSADKITVTGYFTADGASSYKLEEVRFADGTVWSVAKVKELALQSTAGADVLTGYATDDVLTGGAGNDFLAGEGGNDTLSGGAGNDTLNGGAGNNTYLYRKGDGSDTISGFANSTAGKNNVLVFSDGIVPDEVALQRSGTALVVSFAGSSDKITLADVFYSSATGNSSGPVQTLQFENGTVWSITAGGSVTNILNGQAGRDIIVVADTSKNNVLAGGAGDDVLFGGSYADTYLFNLGDGKDTLVETATYGSITDVLRFGEGISAGDLEVRKVGVDLLLVHSNGRDQVTLKNWFNGTGATANVVDASRIERIEFADGSSWDAAVIQNQIVTRGSELADSLSGWVGNDFIHAGAGDDVIDGGTGINHLFGEAGNDTLKVAATAKDSLLVGGLGNDTLLGSSYNDTYVFNLGDGKDTIVEAATYSSVVDVLSFGAGIAASDIQVVRVGTDLLLAHSNGNDQVTIKNWFNSVTSSADVVDASRIERVTFADGTSWGVTELQSQILVLGTEQADTLAGWVGNDFIHAGAGNDVVDGGTGTNHLFGNAGNDTLKVAATAKDNLLVGGLGDDTLQGSSYNDTYVFNLGDGRDTIVEAATYSSVVDVLNFGAGIAASDIQVVRVGTDLLLVHSNGSDQVTIKNWFNGTTSLANVVDASRIERVAFADGTIWGVNELQSQILVLGTEQADTLAGWVGNDFIHAGAGNDVVDGGTGTNHLFGNVGNDILKVAATAKDNLLVGGLGDDTLQGSSYNDTYVFNLGDGKDTIVEAATYSGAVDVLSFGAGIAAGDIQVVRVGTDLLLVHGNGSDQVTIKNWFGSAAVTANVVDASRIERIAFADGTNWGVNELQSQILVLGTEQADTLAGWVGNDFIHAGAGDDVIDGGTGTNQLFGDAGNDTLKVATTSRDNLLVGGTGNDTLVGSSYNDTYLFNQGDGQDSIVETATYTGVTDVLRFGEGIDSNDLWFTRNGADLDIAVTGSQDKVSIKNWYASAANHVERFETSNGATLLDSQVQNLVNAMASFSASAPAESGPSADARTQLEVVIAANWQ
jgi:Ca2+-binding RTX toxin-like protein